MGPIGPPGLDDPPPPPPEPGSKPPGVDSLPRGCQIPPGPPLKLPSSSGPTKPPTLSPTPPPPPVLGANDPAGLTDEGAGVPCCPVNSPNNCQS